MTHYAPLEYSKKLADLFPDAEEHLIEFKNVSPRWRVFDSSMTIKSDGKEIKQQHYPAITLEMALEKLPWNFCCGKTSPGCEKGKYWCENWEGEPDHIEYGNYCLEAICKMLLWLKEKGLVKF